MKVPVLVLCHSHPISTLCRFGIFLPVAKVHCLMEEMAQRAGCILQRKTGLKSNKDIWVEILKNQ